MNVSDITRAIGTTCGFVKMTRVKGATTTTIAHTAAPSSKDDVKPALTSSSVSSGFCTRAEPTPMRAKYCPNLRMTSAMLTRPHVAGASSRASTAVVATVVDTLRTWATRLHFMPWTVLLVRVSAVNWLLLACLVAGVL